MKLPEMPKVAYFVAGFPERHVIGEAIFPAGIPGRIVEEMTREEFEAAVGDADMAFGAYPTGRAGEYQAVATRRVPPKIRFYYLCEPIGVNVEAQVVRPN